MNHRQPDPPDSAAGRTSLPGGRPLLARPSSVLAVSAIVCLAYSIAGAAGVWLLQHILTPATAGIGSSIGIPWLPAGIGVGGLLLFGVRAWPGVFFGSWVTWGLVQGDSWPMVLLGAASESASIALIAWLLRVWDYRISLERYRDALILFAAAAIGRVVTSSTDVVGLIAEVWMSSGPSSPLILDEAGVGRAGDFIVLSPALVAYALRWWANTTAGVVLVVPLLAFLRPRGESRHVVISREFALWAAASLLWFVAALSVRGAGPRPSLIAIALVLVIWGAVRFGVTIASLGTLTFAMAAAVGFGLQLGTFAGIGGREGTEVAWGFIGLLSGTALFLTALLSQRERTRRAITTSAERYRRLFLSNPYPMWAEDAETGRILLANPAALREYAYGDRAFLELRGTDLVAAADDVAVARLSHGRALVTSERHRTSQGAEIDVEVTRAPVTFGSRRVRVCFVEPMSERNALRLAVLTAADLERFRLGGTIATQLIPTLSRITNGTKQLEASLRGIGPGPEEALLALGDDVSAAITICKGVTRGASPLQSAAGDLAESLRRLPAALPGLPVTLDVSVRAAAPVTLSMERRDHIYRLVEDAVRIAGARPGAARISVSLDASDHHVRVEIVDDGKPAPAGSPAESLAYRSMAARAAAADGQLRVVARAAAGTVVTFDCGLAGDTGPDATAPAARGRRVAPTPDMPQPEAGVTRDPVVAAAPSRRWLRDVLLLLIAYTAAAGLGLAFVRGVDALGVSYQPVKALPWVAGGIAVAGVLLGGARLWPAIFVGYVLIWHGFGDEGWATVLLAAFAQSAAVVLTVRLLRRFGFRWSFDRLQDFLLLIAAAAAGRALVVPADLVGLQLADAVSPLTASPEMREVIAPARALVLGISVAKLEAVARWWLNGVAGVVLVVPALISWTRPLADVVRRQRQELAAWGIAVTVTGTALLTVGAPGWRLPILGFGLAVVTWAAVRFGTGLASTTILLLSLVATASFGLARGTLAPAGPDEGLGILWGFIALLTATAQVLTTLLAGSDRAERQLQQLDMQYRELFEAVPHAVFAFASADQRIRVANVATSERFEVPARDLLAAHVAILCADARLWRLPAPNETFPERLEVTRETSRGEHVDVEITRVGVDLDGEPGILCFAIDVTERNRLRTGVLEATDLERRNVAREFHDGLGQILTGLQLGVASLRRTAEQRQPLRASGISFVANAADEALRTCEQILRGVSPLQGTDGDLADAVRRLPGRLPPDAKVRLTASVTGAAAVTLPLEAREHVYQIAQEAVTNALKHAGASNIGVTLTVQPSEVIIEVWDDGIGYDLPEPGEGLGLESIRIRASAMHGHLAIARRPSGGTVLRCTCPQTAFAAGHRADEPPGRRTPPLS